MNNPIFLTILALLAFAGNSVLCRLALGDQAVDAASFTSIRIFSGAIFLLFLVRIKTNKKLTSSYGSWVSSACLFVYAATFSFAYMSLDTGTGALILFGFVQATMIIFSLMQGHKLLPSEWFGLCVAFIGLCILLLPGASAPSLNGFMLMAISGIAWGIYTIKGKSTSTPLLDTAGNFLRALPLAVLLLLLFINESNLSFNGVMLAILSGTVTSGLGYAIWYAALKEITVTQAAIFQLLVPIIAAVAGVLFSDEIITQGLLLSAALILGGIATFVLARHTRTSQP